MSYKTKMSQKPVKENEECIPLLLHLGKRYPLWLDWTFTGVSRRHIGQTRRLKGVHFALHDI